MIPEHDENIIAYMNMIQGVITRLEINCFTLKTLAIGISSVFLVFLGTIDNPNLFYLIAVYLPIIIFWLMDAKYLKLGRCFRRLFNEVRLHKNETPFSMDISVFKKKEQRSFRIMFSWFIFPFYFSILFIPSISFIIFKFIGA